ncbi:phosphoacetylglucosamine mutase activity protein [[Candida] boidinii]|nr:phosphoacetylglucosamine mutase activity protein [[Candida] boidinii]
MSLPISQLQSYFNLYPKDKTDKFVYGTAGFRMHNSKLDSIVFRTGILAVLRSKYLRSQTIGIMITASHNPPQDNGIKMVDPMGEMLNQNWESFATKLSNCNEFNEFVDVINEIVSLNNIDLSKPAKVIIARDSRESGERLLKCVIDGISSINGDYQDFGLLTTPQLHYLTRSCNDSSFGKATENGYYEKLSSSFISILELWNAPKEITDIKSIDITIDAANGIGASTIEKLSPFLKDIINFTVINSKYNEPSALNVDCGADFVKTNQKLPSFGSGSGSGSSPFTSNQLYCSFDGDADRIVFYYYDETTGFHLLDGDRIATLLALFINSLLENLDTDLKLGIVQTAYANGSSTNFIKDKLKLPVSFTPTGVKHLHHEASKNYDIGIYFEANGHGTVLFSNKFIETLKNYKIENKNNNQDLEFKSLETLQILIDLINQTVGDSISDLLTVLVALRLPIEKSPQDWFANYKDLPNKLLKVKVKDRLAFKTTNAERTLVEPAGLQDKIDQLVSKYPNGRSFVRASGTEDAVRVYAEADTKEHCLELADSVADLVKQFS